ncbi:MAG: peptidase M4 family protein [Streptosporangiales bacterium]|nr:peptidase M4 family protein [Streptosporangiales bacterium]
MTAPICCSIVPPFLLDALGRADDTAMSSRALHTLQTDQAVRTARARAAKVTEENEPNRTIYDANNAETLPGDVVREENEEPTGDDAVDDSYAHLGATWRFFSEAYDRNSINGRGLPLLATVHYGEEYQNAFWNGDQMVFGDGDGTVFLAFTGPLDITAHELTHGVTQYTANLAYENQAGALNESMSDVFGVLTKQHKLEQTADQADWLIGKGLLGPDINGKALRSMAEPGTAYDDPQLGKDPQPATMDDYVDTTDDNGGVHINSGIPNHAFYLAATALGGNAWERAGLVWYQVLTSGDLATDADFATFAELTVDQAGSLDKEVQDAVKKAWTDVKVLS